MKAEEYFGDWIDVIDKEELRRVVTWAEQGILMINTALTCEVGRVGAHFDIWKPFVSKLIHNMSYKDNRSISSSILC